MPILFVDRLPATIGALVVSMGLLAGCSPLAPTFRNGSDACSYGMKLYIGHWKYLWLGTERRRETARPYIIEGAKAADSRCVDALARYYAYGWAHTPIDYKKSDCLAKWEVTDGNALAFCLISDQ